MADRRLTGKNSRGTLPGVEKCSAGAVDSNQSRPEIVSSKAENYLLYEAGAYGNKFRTWNTLEEITASGFSGKIVMRYRGKSGGAHYPRLGEQIPLSEASATLREWVAEGAEIGAVAYNEAAPDHALLMQGELVLSIEHISLFYSMKKTTMRLALREGKHSSGLQALALLQQSLFPSSWSDIQELLERFPDSVIEFSAFEHAVGFLRGRNCVIWEVRNY
jgi:hypothetical protein